MRGKKFSEVDHDAWLLRQAEEYNADKDDERYDIIKEWQGYTDEEMEEVDLDSEWENYVEYQEECKAEHLAELREEALIARMESRADYW